MNENIPISIVIPTYNEENWVKLPLESLQNQDFDGRCEIIVVDKDSSDGTPDIARDFGATVINEPREGVSRARQTGFKAAHHPIIATTDADTIVSEEWLSTISKTFQNQEVAGTYGPCTLYDSTPMYSLLAKYCFSGFLRINHLLGKPHFAGFNMAVSKTAFEKTEGFDSSIKSAEDVDLARRLKKQGKIIYNPDLKVQTSGRRIEDWGLVKFLIHHSLNYFNVVLRGQPEKAREFDDIR